MPILYRVSFRDRLDVYVGEAQRSVNMRIQDHFSAYINRNPSKSGFTTHLIEGNHVVDDEKYLHSEASDRKFLALEGIETVRHDNHRRVTLVNPGLGKISGECPRDLKFQAFLLYKGRARVVIYAQGHGKISSSPPI